jgi:hypothetical protein
MRRGTREDVLRLWDEATEQTNALWPQIPSRRLEEIDTAFGQYEEPIYALSTRAIGVSIPNGSVAPERHSRCCSAQAPSKRLLEDRNARSDGVVVVAIDDNVVLGQGEWDPPGGWRPFQVSLESGETLVES